MTALKARIGRIEGRLHCWQAYFVVEAYMRQQAREAEERRRAAEKAREAEREARAAREAAERERREAEVAAEWAALAQAKTAPSPSPAPPSAPPPPAWTYDPPPEMQIRPVSWGRSQEPYDYGGTNGRALTEYDPLADEDDYDYDD